MYVVKTAELFVVCCSQSR